MALIKIKQIENLSSELSGLSTDIVAAESTAIVVAGSLDTVLETALSADIVAAESTAISHANSLDVVMDGRVDTLEAAIIEDDEFFVETFAGTPVLGPYTLANSVQDNEVELVWAYVNGVSVEVATVSGTQVTLATPGYAIDANDTVKFHYQSA